MEIEQLYCSMNQRIFPSAELWERVRSYGKASPQRMARPKTLRNIVVAAALLGCCCFALPALAVNSPGIYRLMYGVSPAVAQFFVPVEESSVDNGIRMELISAYVHGDTAEVYVSMQDLTGDRVDGAMDLYDSQTLRVPFDSVGTCRQVFYDGETKTATFLIRIFSMDGSDIRGGKTTFSISCFLSRAEKQENVPLTVDWTGIEEDPETLKLSHPYGGHEEADPLTGEKSLTPAVTQVLKPGQGIAVLKEGFILSGMGYVDGRLHIQLHVPGRGEFDDHAFLELKDGDGNVLPGDMVYHGHMDAQGEKTDTASDYIDYVFDISLSQLKECTLVGSFYAAKLRTEGSWQVTFPLQTSGE